MSITGRLRVTSRRGPHGAVFYRPSLPCRAPAPPISASGSPTGAELGRSRLDQFRANFSALLFFNIPVGRLADRAATGATSLSSGRLLSGLSDVRHCSSSTASGASCRHGRWRACPSVWSRRSSMRRPAHDAAQRRQFRRPSRLRHVGYMLALAAYRLGSRHVRRRGFSAGLLGLALTRRARCRCCCRASGATPTAPTIAPVARIAGAPRRLH